MIDTPRRRLLPGALRLPADLTQRGWLALLTAYVLALPVGGLLWEHPAVVGAGLLRILTSPGILISDYVLIGGPGAALVNAGLVGLCGLLLVQVSGASLSGPTIAAVFTMVGFGLFGKTVWSIWPPILGVMLFARVTGHSLKSYILVALFGTALAPLVTQVAYGLALGEVAGVLAGVAAGFVLPPLAVYMLRLHQGYNLYNVGLTCGFLGLLVTALLEGAGLKATLPLLWSDQHSEALSWLLLAYVSLLLVLGLLSARGIGRLRLLLREGGRLPSDLVSTHGAATVLINMGLVGLLGWAYIHAVGGAFNGPTLGGVLTMVGFAAFGKHPLNSAPVMLGVLLGSLGMVWHPAQPGPLLAALFGTTLAPLSGGFGPLVGVLAGVLHLTMVMRTAPWHGGMNLYNNGFAGGLTATLLVGIISWWSTWREERTERR